MHCLYFCDLFKILFSDIYMDLVLFLFKARFKTFFSEGGIFPTRKLFNTSFVRQGFVRMIRGFGRDIVVKKLGTAQ